MTQPAVMGVDIGTTGVRAMIYRPDGSALANQSMDYPLYTPQAAWAEQDPEEIYQATLLVIARAVQESKLPAQDITGMCFSSVFHSTIPVDTNGNALHPMLIWADTRSQHYTEKIIAEDLAQNIYAKTACPPHPMYPFYKILWFRYEKPAIFTRTAKFISIKEYILYRLLGKYIVDKSIASGTSIYNAHSLQWDPILLDMLGIDESKLSEVKPTTHIERSLKPEVALSLGLNPQIAIILGAGDGVLSNLGAGAVHPGQITAMIGTSGAVRVITDKPQIDQKRRTWCYNLTDDHWVVGGAINNGGIAFRWLRDKLGESEMHLAETMGLDAYDILSGYAEQVPVGSDGLILLPFFSGERAPYWNANARATFFGLNLNHGKPHMVRATLEGVIYSMFSVFRALEDFAGSASEVRVSGSFTRSKLWLQIMADVFGRTISVPGEPQGSAFGAAALGMYALGMIKDLEAIGKLIPIIHHYEPNGDNHKRYSQLFSLYERIYWNLQQEFMDIAEIQRTWK